MFGALSGLLVGLLHTNTPDNLGFLVADLSVSSDTPSSDFMLKFRETCAAQYEVHIGKRYASPSDCIVRADSIWQNVVSEFEYRKECRQEEPDCVDFGKSLFFVLALGSLSQMAEFRPVSGRMGLDVNHRLPPDILSSAEKEAILSAIGVHNINSPQVMDLLMYQANRGQHQTQWKDKVQAIRRQNLANSQSQDLTVKQILQVWVEVEKNVCYNYELPNSISPEKLLRKL